MTAETNHQLQTHTAAPPPVIMGFSNMESFEFLQRSARAFAASTMVPTAYQTTVTKGYGRKATTEENPAAIPNCMIALDMAQRMNANPLQVMQNLHVIEGKPSWSSQFIIAAINNSGKFSPLRFDLEWLEEMDASYSTFEWEDGQKRELKHTIRIRNARCIAWATERATGQRLESAPVTMEMAVNEGWYGKNGSKWRSMPDLMLRYRSAAFFGRIYAPELLMGLPTAEEVHDVFVQDPAGNVVHDGRQSVPPSSGTIDSATGEVKDEPATWPDDLFAQRLPEWRKAIAAKKANADAIVAKAKTKHPLTEEQVAAIRAPITPEETAAAAPKSAPAAAAEAPTDVEVKAAADAPAVTYAQVADDMHKASNEDALNKAAVLISAIADNDQREELNALYDTRLAALQAS